MRGIILESPSRTRSLPMRFGMEAEVFGRTLSESLKGIRNVQGLHAALSTLRVGRRRPAGSAQHACFERLR